LTKNSPMANRFFENGGMGGGVVRRLRRSPSGAPAPLNFTPNPSPSHGEGLFPPFSSMEKGAGGMRLLYSPGSSDMGLGGMRSGRQECRPYGAGMGWGGMGGGEGQEG